MSVVLGELNPWGVELRNHYPLGVELRMVQSIDINFQSSLLMSIFLNDSIMWQYCNQKLTHYGQVTPYGDIDPGQH